MINNKFSNEIFNAKLKKVNLAAYADHYNVEQHAVENNNK